jgi:hypothetical protein
MIDINNEDMTRNQTFIRQMHTSDDTNMATNDFDRYDRGVYDMNIFDKDRCIKYF